MIQESAAAPGYIVYKSSIQLGAVGCCFLMLVLASTYQLPRAAALYVSNRAKSSYSRRAFLPHFSLRCIMYRRVAAGAYIHARRAESTAVTLRQQ